jgi:hypothetical protein
VPDAPLPGGPRTVDEVRARLESLTDRPVGEHVAVYDEVHRVLQDRLATLDEA